MDTAIGSLATGTTYPVCQGWCSFEVLAFCTVVVVLGGAVVVLARLLKDVRSRYREECAARSRAERELSEREQRLQTIFDSQLECVKLYDVHGTILTMNRAGMTSLGEYRAGPVLGASVYGFIAPEHHERYRALTADVFAGNSGSMEMRLTCPEGRPRLMDTHVVPMRDAHGTIVAALAVTRDITDRREAEESAQRHLRELARVARACSMGEMASGLAHELNQPLAAMVNHANACTRYLHSVESVSPRVVESLNEISAQGQRAAQIIRNVRELVTGAEPSRSLVDVNDVVRTIIRLIRSESGWHNVNIQTELDPNAGAVFAAKVELEQVLFNILKNAIEAVEAANGGECSVISLVTLRGHQEIELAVSDQGPGISRADISRIFDPFFTTKEQGMGMGLSISRSIVEAHGGRMLVRSNPGSGATFRLLFPIQEDRRAA